MAFVPLNSFGGPGRTYDMVTDFLGGCRGTKDGSGP
jgi:hypothetical protein